ncbi:hypothetical protein HPC49_31600 [Pyxidicoccus fallax]|uniref:Uncharacterized protein n=1 Tax=Pyxidicoccus fallax TaxID=394095 RepID=A0A848LSG0_9BACT|nr:hypothetical protein [Pyxidicoccus fallax]NPC82755.1 hypothetical protein [Pyxidicoccus fallax]
MYLLGALCACSAPVPRVPPVSPEGSTPAGPFVPEARALFEGCTSVPDSAESRTYRCGDVSVWLTEVETGSLADVLTQARERITARFGREDVVEVSGELPLAGSSWPSTRFAVCRGADGGASTEGECRAGGYSSAVTVQAGRLRGLGCVARGNARPLLARCLELLEYVASRGNPEGDVLGAEALLVPPRLPWRSLAVPQGCQLAASTTRAGRIRCGDSSFAWNVYVPARTDVTARWRDQGVAELAEALPGSGPVEEVPCRLEGQPARCSRFTAPTARGPLVVWAAATEWEDRALYASCSFPQSEAPFPAACNGAFSLP